MNNNRESAPLSSKLRPDNWSNFENRTNLPEGVLERLRAGNGSPPSLILWGPPGTGKTTFARLIGASSGLSFESLVAVDAGVKEVRAIAQKAKDSCKPTVLFLDEIHRFSRSQQEVLLPFIESGEIILIGATTENPSFVLSNALLSRTTLVRFQPLEDTDLLKILERAERATSLGIVPEGRMLLAQAAQGDARRLLNIFEGLVQSIDKSATQITTKDIGEFLGKTDIFRYDRDASQHYSLISAMIKSLRGSDADAALYWAFRMLESGEDPRFVFRRLLIFASEDIGNADPRALMLTNSAAEAFERVGLPEGRIIISQCITYLASVPKSNRSYEALNASLEAVRKYPNEPVPPHLCNAPTKLMQELGFGSGYQYPHDYPGAYVPGVQYLPDKLAKAVFYRPSEQGFEKNFKRKT